MKGIISILFLIISCNVFGQYPNNPTPGSVTTNTKYLGPVSSNQGHGYNFYTDTTTANTVVYLRTVPGMTIATPGLMWQRNPSATKWVCINGACGGLVGGIVSYSGTGLGFNITAATNYCINNNAYSSLGGSVTLTTANPSLPRQDVIFVDTFGLVGVKTGTAAASPAVPQIDPLSQYALTSILVPAGATTPGGLTQKIIYDENLGTPTEWAPSAFGTIVTAFNDTHNPYHLVKNIKNTLINPTSTRTGLQFTNTSTVNVNDYSVLNFHIASISGTGITANVFLTMSGFVVTGGIPVTITSSTSYQNFSIPISSFNFAFDLAGGNIYNGVQIQFTSLNVTGVFIDYINLQGGIPSGSSNYVTNVYRKNATDSLFQVKNGISYFVSLMDTTDQYIPLTGTISGHPVTGNILFSGTHKLFALTANGSVNLGLNAASTSMTTVGGSGTNFWAVGETSITGSINGSQKIAITSTGLQYTPGSQANGYILTSDASGNATWQAPAGGAETLQQVINNGADLSGQENDIIVGSGVNYFTFNNTSHDEQLLINPGRQYSFGDLEGDYGMGYINITRSPTDGGQNYLSFFSPDFSDVATPLPDTSGIRFYTDSLSTTPTGIFGYDDKNVLHKYSVQGVTLQQAYNADTTTIPNIDTRTNILGFLTRADQFKSIYVQGGSFMQMYISDSTTGKSTGISINTGAGMVTTLNSGSSISTAHQIDIDTSSIKIAATDVTGTTASPKIIIQNIETITDGDRVAVFKPGTDTLASESLSSLGLSQPANQITYGTGTGISSTPNLTYDGDELKVFDSNGFLKLNTGTSVYRMGDIDNNQDGDIIYISQIDGAAWYDNVGHNGKFGFNINAPVTAVDVLGEIQVNNTNPSSRGIQSSTDFTANITSLDYTQKKYVDDAIAGAVPSLQSVTDVGNITTDDILVQGSSSASRLIQLSNSTSGSYVELALDDDTGNGELRIYNTVGIGIIKANNITSPRAYQLPDASGTFALTTDIPVLTNGNGTLANGTEVDLGGELSQNTTIDLRGNDFNIGGNLSSNAISLSTGISKIGDFISNNNGTYLGVDDNNELGYFANDHNRFKFGINTTTPTEACDIVGNVQLSGYEITPPDYETPTTGSTITTVKGMTIIEPAGALLALTIALPLMPADGQRVQYSFTQAVTTLTFTGGTLANAITTTAAGGTLGLIYGSTGGKWYKTN